MKIEYQDKIDNYLLNRMTDEERQEFEREVEQDRELQEQLKFTENVQTALKSREEKLARIKAWQKEMDEAEKVAANYRMTGSDENVCAAPSRAYAQPPVSRQKNRKVVYWISGIAAIFIIGLLLFPIMHISTSMDSSVESGALRGDEGYDSIRSLIEQRQFKEAIVAIEQEEQSLEQELSANKTDTIDRGRQEYDRLLLVEKKGDLMWLKVHALLGLDKNEEAKAVLDWLRKTEGKYQMAADSLFNRLQ